jgi:hypothetical protein
MPPRLANESGVSAGGKSVGAAGNWVAALRGLAGHSAPAEHCDLCGATLEQRHVHLIEADAKRLLCACVPCALLFGDQSARRYRRVPERVALLANFRLEPAQWDALRIPINIVFFFRSAAQQRWIAMYPGPGGAIQSQLDLSAWEDLVQTNPTLAELEDDVEAVLLNRLNGAAECFRIPIDRCYALVGLMRSHWRGIGGGPETELAISNYVSALRAEAGGSADAAHA